MTAEPREEMLKLRALIEADQQHLADIDQTIGALADIDQAIGALYERRGEVLDRFQGRQSRLRSMEVAHYARFAADASVEAADVRDQAQKRAEDFRSGAA